jgi:hypothetical protein
MSAVAIGARQVQTEVAIGDVVTIERPPGTYRWLGDKDEQLHRSRPIVTTPTGVVLIREVNEHRDEAWIVLANKRAYPASWVASVERTDQEEEKGITT